MRTREETIGKIIALAAVTGMRTVLGPAMLASARRTRGREGLALAAVGEMAFDKMPMVPGRDNLSMMIPRAMAGYWVASEVANDEGLEDRWAPIMGAAVAMGVAWIAPKVRRTIHRGLGIPDPVLGLAEDALALGIGGAALGMTVGDVKAMGEQAYEQVRQGHVGPALRQAKDRLLPGLPI